MNADFLGIVFGIGGILVLPFNSIILGAIVSHFLGVNYKVWQEASKRIWVLQILWNLLFLSIGVGIKHAEKITYTVTRAVAEPRPNYREEWQYHFYNGKGKEIANDSEEATPFQKRLNRNDPIGLDSGDEELYGVDLKLKLDDFSYDEVSKFIDRYNARHTDSLGTDILMVPVAAVLLVFYIMLCEALIISFIVFCGFHPILAGVLFGPSLWRIFKASRS